VLKGLFQNGLRFSVVFHRAVSLALYSLSFIIMTCLIKYRILYGLLQMTLRSYNLQNDLDIFAE